MLSANGVLGSVGVNYLPVNAAPVIDDLVVATGARLNPQNQIPSVPATVNIAFPSSASSTDGAGADSSSASPISALKDRTAVTVRWAAHDDNGDDLISVSYTHLDVYKRQGTSGCIRSPRNLYALGHVVHRVLPCFSNTPNDRPNRRGHNLPASAHPGRGAR